MKRLSVAVFVSLLALMMACPAFALSPMVFDRGLPTANLNDVAGQPRSNINWADGESTATTSPYYLPGDDFKIGTSGSYHIDTIRVWATTNNNLTADFNLFAGQPGGISLWSNSYTATPVTYINGEGYQGSSGAMRQIYQIDFAVNRDVSGGALYQFFLDGPWSVRPDGLFSNPYLHASNAALSGSPQDGADGKFLYLEMNNGVPNQAGLIVWDSLNGGGGWPGGGFLTSDANVQVYGTPVPSTVVLLGSGLAGLVVWRRRRAAAKS